LGKKKSKKMQNEAFFLSLVNTMLLFVARKLGKYAEGWTDGVAAEPQSSRYARWSARCAGCAPSAGLEVGSEAAV
jgi:hypothetical protein